MPASPDDGARHAQRVADVVAQVEQWLLTQLAETLAAGADRDDWATQALARLRIWRARAARHIDGARKELEDVVAEVLFTAHSDGYALGITDLPDGTPTPSPAPATGVLTTADQLAATIHAATQQAPRLLEQIYQQAVAAGAAEVTGGKATRLQAAQSVLDQLLAQGIRGYRDAAGRNWALTSYVEMAVRTEAGKVAVDGHTAALTDAGLDLVVVSDSPRECPLCRPWEGKVLSLGGNVASTVLQPSLTGGPAVRVQVAGTLAEARAAGLFHPNCTHSVSAYLPGATRLAKPKQDPAAYEAKQRQRAMERKVREWKRRQALALDDAAAARARAKVREWQQALRDHVDAHDLKRLSYREQIGKAH